MSVPEKVPSDLAETESHRTRIARLERRRAAEELDPAEINRLAVECYEKGESPARPTDLDPE
jgi:hypothetical protein